MSTEVNPSQCPVCKRYRYQFDDIEWEFQTRFHKNQRICIECKKKKRKERKIEFSASDKENFEYMLKRAEELVDVLKCYVEEFKKK